MAIVIVREHIARKRWWILGPAFLFVVAIGLFVFPFPLRSNTSSEVFISKKVAQDFKEGNIPIFVDGDGYIPDEIGIEIDSNMNWRTKVLMSILKGGQVYELSVNPYEFLSFIESGDSSTEGESVILVRNDSSGEAAVLGESSVRDLNSESLVTQIIEGLQDGQDPVKVTLIGDSESGSQIPEDVDFLAYITSDIYVQYRGMTVVLDRSDVMDFVRTDCPNTEEHCGVEVPCVKVNEVRDHVDVRLTKLWQSLMKYETLTNNKGSFTYEKSGWMPNKEGAVESIVKILSQRIENFSGMDCNVLGVSSDMNRQLGTVNNIVSVGEVDNPGTDGTYAAKYIEIDDSDQHLYAWENGEIVMEYDVSGFYLEYAVYGVFQVYEKSPNAWSPIAEKWMPYWLSYYYDPIQQAWFGIHELVWWDDENGVRHYESADSIGKRKSGGCIRLDRGPAKIVYDWADVGMPVLIHP